MNTASPVFDRSGFFSVKNYAVSFQDEYAVFPSMLMQWAVASRFHLKEPHGVLCSDFCSDEPSDFCFGATFFFFLRRVLGISDFQGFHLNYVSSMCIFEIYLKNIYNNKTTPISKGQQCQKKPNPRT